MCPVCRWRHEGRRASVEDVKASVGRRPARAVVLGAGMTGLLATRVLLDHVDEVVLVERDHLDAPGRRGVPQTPHTHGLLSAGLSGMEGLLPGLTDELVAGGAQAGAMEDVSWRINGHRLALGGTGLQGIAVSRSALEGAVRRRVLALPGVVVRDGCDVEAPLAADGRVTGVRVRPQDAADEDLSAELVVDTLGRGSRTPRWMADLGLRPPPQDEVRVDVRYVTWAMRRTPGQVGALTGEVVGAAPPLTRAAVVLAVEQDVWSVTLAGYFGDRPPVDLEGFRRYADSLGGVLAEIVRGSEPLGEPVRYHYPTSRWRHYEKALPPAGLLPLGDAVCSFNPVYGQGISSATQQVLALDRRLRATAALEPARRQVVQDAAEVAAVPWALAVGVDRQFSQLGRKPLRERVLDRYLARVLTVAEHDQAVALAFFRVVNLLDPPSSIMAPSVVRRVVPPQRRSPSPVTG